MKNILLSLLLTSTLSSCVKSQAAATEPTKIPLVIRPGGTAEISYTHTKQKNGITNKGEVTATLKILSLESDNQYRATWTTNSVKVGKVLIDENSPQASSMFIGVPFTYLGISDGQPVRVEDTKKLITELRASPAFKDHDTKTLDQVIDFFESMDEETLAHIFVKAPSFMSICHETGFVVGEPLKSQAETPSPAGEGLIVSDITYLLKSINEKKGLAKIEYRSAFDPESVTKVALQTLKKIAPDAPIPQEEIDKLIVDREDRADCLVDISTGWVNTMTYSTEIKADDTSQKEIFDIAVKWVD